MTPPICSPSTSSSMTSWPGAPAGHCEPTPRARPWPWPYCGCRSSCRPIDWLHCGRRRREEIMNNDLVLYEARPPAVVLTLNRPDRRNALSRGLIAALADAFTRAREDPAARCIVLTGAGSSFCAGMDLAELEATVTHEVEADAVWEDALRLA